MAEFLIGLSAFLWVLVIGGLLVEWLGLDERDDARRRNGR